MDQANMAGGDQKTFDVFAGFLKEVVEKLQWIACRK